MCQITLHTEISGLIKSSRRDRASCLRIKSRACGPSPAIFPKAHTACSLTKGDTDLSSFTNFSTAPCSITFCVCSDVPEAIFVNTHAASNCKQMLGRNKKIIYINTQISFVRIYILMIAIQEVNAPWYYATLYYIVNRRIFFST